MMSETGSAAGRGCEGIRELVAWLPAGTLDDEERRKVEDHLAVCPSCTEILRFASGLKEGFLAIRSCHPEPDLLVRFVEERETLTAGERPTVETHLAICGECAREVTILETVGREVRERGAQGEEPARSSPRPSSRWRERIGSLWNGLTGSLLRPVPAAAYLTVAVAAVALLVVRPSTGPEPKSGETGIASRPQGETLLGSVVLLSDRSGGFRGESAGTEEVPLIDADRSQFLLLEFTDLATPPRSDDLYRVRLTPEGGGEPVWEQDVAGSVFEENYTLGLLLARGALGPGRYDVLVIGPGEEAIFRSMLEVR